MFSQGFGKNSDGGCSAWKERQGATNAEVDLEHWRHLGHEVYEAEGPANSWGIWAVCEDPSIPSGVNLG